MAINYTQDKVTGFYVPTPYPVKYDEDMAVPKVIAKDFNSLTSLIEDKYQKEFLKVCAFYNKLFPSLKAYDWSRSSYNVVPFTLQDQERSDTGTGLSSNYLKAIVDLVVARIGNINFDYRLIAEQPTALYAIYKDEIERILKSLVRKNNLDRISVEAFHDAAVVSFSHIFVDPWSHEVRKINDWELGCYESEFSDGKLKRVMIRDFAFPVSGLGPYLHGFPEEKILEITTRGSQVDLRLYIDCFRHKKYVTVGQLMSPETDYNFDEVLLSTLSWDLGIRRTTVTSLFDLLYPIQRALNKLLAKKTQLLTMYKGPVPVFSHDADVIIKQLSNGAGEALFLDTQRNPAELVTMINPTPLDPALNAEIESLKAQMFELAGVQQISMDIENYRSAAAVIALDQMRDAGFQSQLASLASFIRDVVLKSVRYMEAMQATPVAGISWSEVNQLITEAYIDIKPIHDNEMEPKGPQDPNYIEMLSDKFIQKVLFGQASFDDIDYSYDRVRLYQKMALKLVELKALENADVEGLGKLTTCLVQAYVEEVKLGKIGFMPVTMPAEVPVG